MRPRNQLFSESGPLNLNLMDMIDVDSLLQQTNYGLHWKHISLKHSIVYSLYSLNKCTNVVVLREFQVVFWCLSCSKYGFSQVSHYTAITTKHEMQWERLEENICINMSCLVESYKLSRYSTKLKTSKLLGEVGQKDTPRSLSYRPLN